MSILKNSLKVGSRPDERRINCPFCAKKVGKEDTGHHCYVNLAKGVFQCFRCASRGSVSKLGIELKEHRLHTDLSSVKDKILGRNKVDGITTIPIEEFSKPLTPDVPIAWKYAMERGFDQALIDKWGLRVGFSEEREYKKWNGRILFPLYMDKDCVYIVARTYVGGEPKYLNSRGNKTLFVYGLDRVTTEEALVCEGIISSIAAERYSGMQAVSVLGKSISRNQVMKIKSKVSKVTICLDGGVTDREIKDMVMKFKREYFTVNVIKIPGSYDPDELGPRFKEFFDKRKEVKLI